MNISRRQFIKSCITASLLAGTGSLLMYPSYSIETLSYKIPIRNLHKDFDGYRIGFLTDFHLGPFVREEWIEEAFRRIAALKVDLLLLGGDYQGFPDSTLARSFGDFNNSKYTGLSQTSASEKIFDDFFKLLSLVSPPDGIVAVYGNHDRRSLPDICARTFSRRTNLVLLENGVFTIKRGTAKIEIVGIADYLTAVPEFPKALDHSTRILLSHNPDSLSAMMQNDIMDFDFILCGHTHGGQIKLPLIGALTYNISNLRFAEGLVLLNQTVVYTSRGLGMVEIPLRINCPAEITVFALEQA